MKKKTQTDGEKGEIFINTELDRLLKRIREREIITPEDVDSVL